MEERNVAIISVKKPSNLGKGGAETVWSNLRRKGLSFVNFSLEQKTLPGIYKKIPNIFHLREIFSSKWLLKKADKQNPKLIIYDKIFGWPRVKTNAKKICYNRGSYTIAGLEFEKKNKIVYFVFKYFMSYFERRSYENADKIIAVSQSTKNEMVQYFGIKSEKIRVINNRVDLKIFREMSDKRTLRKKHSLPLDKKIILFPGRPSYGKGFDIAKKIIEKLGEEYILLVMEKGHSESKKIKFTGKVRNELTPEIYNCADVTLFPTRYEGNSVSVLESAACGTPLVLSNAGLMKTNKKMSDFVCNNEKEYMQKIKNLFADKDFFKKSSEKWKNFAKDFPIEEQIKELKNYIKNESK